MNVVVFDNNNNRQDNRRLCGTFPEISSIKNITVKFSPPQYSLHNMVKEWRLEGREIILSVWEKLKYMNMRKNKQTFF